ncbi:hypothetical protein M0657_003880 [Pyricularia oryzae]|nr:hypothetical protein M0657_003880 [Pyricularia oryzae]
MARHGYKYWRKPSLPKTSYFCQPADKPIFTMQISKLYTFRPGLWHPNLSNMHASRERHETHVNALSEAIVSQGNPTVEYWIACCLKDIPSTFRRSDCTWIVISQAHTRPLLLSSTLGLSLENMEGWGGLRTTPVLCVVEWYPR